jgi:hypothetical protein
MAGYFGPLVICRTANQVWIKRPKVHPLQYQMAQLRRVKRQYLTGRVYSNVWKVSSMPPVLSPDSVSTIVTLTKPDKDTLPIFLEIFSVSCNLDCALDVLETVHYRNPLSEMPGTRVGCVL